MRGALDGAEPDTVIDGRLAAELRAAARRFARHDPSASAYLLEMAEALGLDALHGLPDGAGQSVH